MKAFEKVIGYNAIKKELIQVCDMICNKEIYANLGAVLPNGVLLYGEPGLGKTLLAKCFIEECNINTYTIRKNRSTDEFVSEITDTFRKAEENAPAIIFLDDLDKFANEDQSHCDAEEYVAVQAGIDEVKGKGVFVIATANDIYRLPSSLTRAGRFDKKIEVCRPSDEDSLDIIKHYLKDKKLSSDINYEDVAMMLNYSSCAELESILNEAAINAAFERKDSVSMSDLINTILRTEYADMGDCQNVSYEDIRKTALHEAGHIVICEVLCRGSVGLASLRTVNSDSVGGFIRRCKDLKRRPYYILVSLGGKAAVELHHSETCASGCQTDIRNAIMDIRAAVSESGACGLSLTDVSSHRYTSDTLNAPTEAVIHAELERYMFKARDILLKNTEFLHKVTDALTEKKSLLYSDIKAIRESVEITEVPV